MASIVQIVELVSLKREREELRLRWQDSRHRDLAVLIRLAYLGQLIHEIESDVDAA